MRCAGPARAAASRSVMQRRLDQDQAAMIQKPARYVLDNMQSFTERRVSRGVRRAAPFGCRSHARGRGFRRVGAMAADGGTSPERMDWAGLIAAVAKERDRKAFARLFEYFAPRLKTYMRRSGASEAQAEELVQETMLAVWRKAESFDTSSAGASIWIFTIARNLRIDALRRERPSNAAAASDVELEFLIDAAPQPDERAALAQREKLIRRALAQLSDEQMRVVELSFFEEKAHPEIARILQIPLGTVKSRLRLAFKQLRTHLGAMS
jgi:RNA polymerase sigma-70 factor, ECF subfamily